MLVKLFINLPILLFLVLNGLIKQITRQCCLESQRQGQRELVPVRLRKSLANLLNELRILGDHDLCNSLRLSFGDEKAKDNEVGRHYRLKVIKVVNEELVELSDKRLDGELVELALFVVLSATRSLNCQVDVLEQREEHLTQDLTPEAQVENFDARLEHLEECGQGTSLVLHVFLECQVSQVGQDGEPESLEHTLSNSFFGRLLVLFTFNSFCCKFCKAACRFRLLFKVSVGCDTILRRVLVHVLLVTLEHFLSLL